MCIILIGMVSKSKNGFQTKVWGPAAWLLFHTISLNYNPIRKKEYKQFFTSIAGVLPCGACRENYDKIIKTKLPITDLVLSNRDNFAKWLFDVHNMIQDDIFKHTKNPQNKVNDLNFETRMEQYESFRASPCSKKAYGCTRPLRGLKKHCRIKICTGVKPKNTIKYL